LWDAVPRPAKNLFEKRFLELQKLLKMGVIKPRPSGEVAAVRLTERAIICKECCEALPCTRMGTFLAGLCPAPARELFEKSSLDLQKLLIIGVIYSPPRHVVPNKKNNASTSLVQARLGQALFFLLVLWTMAVREAICRSPVGVGALDDPFKRLSKTAFDTQTKRFSQTKAFPCQGRGTAIAVDE